MQRFAARALRSIARRLGHTPRSPAARHAERLTERLFKSIAAAGLKPNHIVDVGSNRGRWTRAAVKFFPACHFSMIEPNPELRRQVHDLLFNPRVHYHSIGIGAENASLAFTVHARDNGSSTFAMSHEDAEREGFEQIIVPIMRLDDLLRDSNLPAPEIIKIDAEGLDLDVISGGSESIRTAEVVLVEAGICNRSFKNDLGSVISAMRQLGLSPLDITDLNRTPEHGNLWLVEIAFAKSGGMIERYSSSFR